MPTPLTFSNPIDTLLDRGTRDSAGPALASRGGEIGWRDLDERGDRLAASYLRLGLKPGDRIASLMPNRPELVIHYIACLKAGLVATPLNYRYMPPEIDHALGVSKAAVLVYHAEREADIRQSTLAGRLPLGRIRFDSEATDAPRLEDLIAGDKSPLPSHDLDAPAFIYFTSGSTGKPKGVTHTRRTYGAMLAVVAQALDLSKNDVMLPASSFSHIGGSVFSLAALAAGSRVVVPEQGDSGEVLDLLRRHLPTILWMLPAALIGLVRDHDAQPGDFASIRLCMSGGDKVAAELEREFTHLANFPIDENYGMTEIGMATISPPRAIRLGSIGQLCPGFELSLRDDASEAAPVQQGRMWVRSATNMIGYWDNPAATAETIQGGWLDTGDIMRVDDDGYLWFCGRKKQIIIHDGSNICPQEVEEAVAEHPAVEAVGVIGIHDMVHGENVRAYVTVKAGAVRPSPGELVAFAKQRVGYKAPEEIVFLDEMPLNATGKVDRVALKARAEQSR